MTSEDSTPASPVPGDVFAMTHWTVVLAAGKRSTLQYMAQDAGFYQMFTGELPGKTIAPPSAKVQIDARLDEIVLRALEKKSELRHRHVSEVKTMVKPF